MRKLNGCITEIRELCANCPYGLNEEKLYENADINEWLELLIENGYVTAEEDEEKGILD